jgi:CheY-like chemotaxis protein
MTNRRTPKKMTGSVNNVVVEGSSEKSDEREPENPLQTTSAPVIKIGRGVAPTAETGLIPAVLMTPREGKDMADSQDSSRTTAENQSAPASQKAPELDSSRSYSVLIIEDTTELAEVIQATLERMNMVTAHETHGNKALSRFDEMNPDIVLLDIGLPDMTGWKFLETVKEKRKGQLPIIIVITAYGDPANKLIGKLQNVHGYLVKPFTPDEVEQAVRAALNTKTA